MNPTLRIIKKSFTPKFSIIVFGLLQAGILALIVLGALPPGMVWINFALGIIFILSFSSYYSLLFLALSVPFYVAIPNPHFSSLSFWRPWFALLFVVFCWQQYRQLRRKGLAVGQSVYVAISDIWDNSLPWDKYLWVFGLGAVIVTLLVAPYPLEGVKQVLFWINLFLLYTVLINVVKTKRQVIEVIIFSAASLGVIVFLGYAQLIATFFTTLDIFWVYWASFISKLYYGPALANVLLYSNSWFSYSGGGEELRMFSIMPDSHSFAMMALYCMSFFLPLTYLCKRAVKKFKISTPLFKSRLERPLQIVGDDQKVLGFKTSYWLWFSIRLAGLAIILSGTRAVWAGLAVPLIVLLLGYYFNYYKQQVKTVLTPYLLIILFFVLSPFINQGLHYLRVSNFKENFIARAQSIYDLQDESNIGRIEIWRNSLKFWVKHPNGVGLGNFLVSLTQPGQNSDFEQLAQQHNKQFNLPQEYVTAHNLYLQILVELGWVGLLLFATFWLKYLYELEKFIRGHLAENNILTFFVFETAVTFLWILSASMFDVTFFNDKVLLYFVISLGLSGVIIKHYSKLVSEEEN